MHAPLLDWLRLALSQYVTNGLSVAVGLVLIVLGVYALDGLSAASAASVGVLVASLPDVPSPKRRKFMQMLPAPALGAPLFLAVQLVQQQPLELGLVLVPGTFLAFMGMAWGKRGGPISFSLMFSMLFSMATPPGHPDQALMRTGWFLAGGALYLVYAVLTAHLLNTRYRVQLLADCLLGLASLLRTQARRFDPQTDSPAAQQALLADVLRQQAALADLLQSTRDVVLESPTKPHRQRLAGMLLAVLEARDHLLACELDLDALSRHDDGQWLPALEQSLLALAASLEALATSLLLGRTPQPVADLRPALARLQAAGAAASEQPGTGALLGSLTDRIGHINDETVKMAALARGDVRPELANVRSSWQLFVSPTLWSWKPLLGQLSWYAPTLRHALRAALAIGVGYTVSLHLPWASHKYWILITIAVVLRANLAQTVERRNARVGGTLLGCVLVMLILSAHPEPMALLLFVALGTAISHAFAIKRYLFTAIAATVSGMLQAHLLMGGISPGFALAERLADTLLGAVLAWALSYVLPSWERRQIPGLVQRTLAAQARHARLALALGQARQPDLDWRLARREAYDSLSALVQATGRVLAEPRSVRPPLEPLEALQARSYQLLAQLTAIKSLLMLRRGQLDMDEAQPALALAAQRIDHALISPGLPAAGAAPPAAGPAQAVDSALMPAPEQLPDNLTPALLRRLGLACDMAGELRLAAARVQTPTGPLHD
ncbi:FUSC family protein [Variovorax sp. CYS-02]|uniref:FUSC family protein n=1 Tax=Variovorax terrae TaxID=2923278 RepID=A0A9X1VT53_9BURK|nr:FUSC family membrane protein [Variovorax terrae]MCJ0762465.1 FUSC family protein [Variovorax terrae]